MLDHIAQLKGVAQAGERKDMVHAILHKVNLYKDRKKHLGIYSGGMKQRFGIAQALVGNPKLIIVDEPTAGLDPAESSKFAIICLGEVLYAGEPERAVKELERKIYSKEIKQSEIENYRERYRVISTQLKSGKLHIRILQNENPGNGFITAEPNLEDVYFSNISSVVDINTL